MFCKQLQRAYSRNVVVTGIGLVTPLGCKTEHVWKKLTDGESGLAQLTFDDCELSCKVAGIVPKGKSEFEFNERPARAVSLASCFALTAADEALLDAGWQPQTEEDQKRSGIAIGTGLADLQIIADMVKVMETDGPRRVSPFFIPAALTNMATGHISIKHKLKGPCHSVSTACTTGAHAIGDAARFIAHGDCDVMVAGGAEANLNKYGMVGFARARALSTKYNDRPKEASRPFNPDRDGFVMGEGSGVLVLEEEQHALRRGANIYARVLGYGLSADANHITAPCTDGRGALASMRAALSDAKVSVNDVTYINAHATSTPLGDAAENQAIKTLCGDHAHSEQFAVSSTKGAVGHLLGAAGAVEAAFTVLSCYHGELPPTLNFDPDNREDGMDLNYVPLIKQKWSHPTRRVALTNSFGFGGTNASLCFSSYP